MKRRFLSLLLVLMMLLPVVGHAEEEAPQIPTLTDRGLDLGTASVHWPQVTGLDNEEIQNAVNQKLTEAANAPALTARMAAVMSSETPLITHWRGEIRGNVLSCVLYAEGPLETDRFRSVWHSVNVDLTTGEAFTLEDLFEDPDFGLERVEECLTDDIVLDLSAHLANSDLLPQPEDFLIESTGLTLYYPAKQLSTLSDRAGAVTITWGELGAPLCEEEESIPVRFGLTEVQSPDFNAFMQSFADGSVPGIPAKLGDSVEELVSIYHLDGEPDLYDGGRYVQLEDSRFRTVWLMTDNLSDRIKAFPDSIVQGIRADRFCLYGVVTGSDVFHREDLLSGYDKPYASVEIDQNAAESMRIVPGVSDYYQVGDYRLRLHYDEEGFLRSIFLLP